MDVRISALAGGLLTCPARETFVRCWNIVILSVMAKTASLSDVPADISDQYLPYIPTLRQRQKAHAFSKGHYLHSIKLFRNEEEIIDIEAKMYRSQRKSEEPHQINMSLDKGKCEETILNCSCKAG